MHSILQQNKNFNKFCIPTRNGILLYTISSRYVIKQIVINVINKKCHLGVLSGPQSFCRHVYIFFIVSVRQIEKDLAQFAIIYYTCITLERQTHQIRYFYFCCLSLSRFT